MNISQEDKDTQQLERDLLYKQSEELFKLRERSIKSIASTFNAYTTFLAFIFTAIGFFIFDGRIETYGWLVLLFIGFALFFYGCYIHHLLFSSHINIIFYTRMMNLTRAYLVSQVENLEEKILLPLTDKEPEFNNLGFFDDKYSEKGVAGFQKWVNSIILGLTFLLLFCLLPPFRIIDLPQNCIFYKIGLCKAIMAGITAFCISLFFHKKHIKKMENKADNKWKEKTDEKKPSPYKK